MLGTDARRLPSDRGADPVNVLIAGGGVAGLEGALALRELAPDRVDVALLTPEQAFEVRALSVRDPFGGEPPRRHALADLARAAGIALRQGRLASVDPGRRVAHDAGGGEHPYDALLVCVGARAEPALPHAVTFAGPQDAEAVHGVLQDLESGFARRIAFVVPPGPSWPLPAYELALMTAERAASLGLADVSLTVITPEEAPLGLFGHQASAALASLLAGQGIAVQTSTAVEPASRVPSLGLGGARAPVPVDRIVALPVLRGPRIRGLPCDDDGFLPADEHGRLRGVERVWAAGDCTAFPVKQGGVAAQQADAAAESIAAAAGADVAPRPFRPVLRGILLTGSGPRWLRAAMSAEGGPARTEAIAEHALWWPPAKVAGRRLAPLLWRLEEGEPPGRPAAAAGVAVDRPVAATAQRPRRRVVLAGSGPPGHLELLELEPERP
jgi:sulfide:quinone oxidoreductase